MDAAKPSNFGVVGGTAQQAMSINAGLNWKAAS